MTRGIIYCRLCDDVAMSIIIAMEIANIAIGKTYDVAYCLQPTGSVDVPVGSGMFWVPCCSGMSIVVDVPAIFEL